MGLRLYYGLKGDHQRANGLPPATTSQDPTHEANQGAWAVMDAMFRLAVRDRFKAGHQDLDLETFAAAVCGKWDEDGPAPSPADLKALIKEGLAGAPDTSQRDNMIMAFSYLAVAKEVAKGDDYRANNNRLIAQLVSNAEDVAIAWDFKPTMRKRKSWITKLWQRLSGRSGER